MIFELICCSFILTLGALFLATYLQINERMEEYGDLFDRLSMRLTKTRRELSHMRRKLDMLTSKQKEKK